MIDCTITCGSSRLMAAITWSKLSMWASSDGLLARISGLASQTISWLTTARVPVTQTIKTKNQIGNASQLWTRNQSFERDFFDMIKGLVSMRGPCCGLRSAVTPESPAVAFAYAAGLHLYRTDEQGKSRRQR